MSNAPARRPRRGTRDPYGIGPIADRLWPALAAVALVVIALVSIGLVQGQLPSFAKAGNGPDSGDGGGPALTPAPSNRVIVPQ